MKWRAVFAVCCVAVGSLKLASSSATPPDGGRPPTTAANYTEPQQPSSLGPNVRPRLMFVANPTFLLKALPGAVTAFVDALAALTSNQATPSPSVTSNQTTPSPSVTSNQTTPSPSVTSNQATPSPSVTRVPREPAAFVPAPYPQRYAVFSDFRNAMPFYAMLLRRGFASQWPPVFVRRPSFATTAAEPEERASGESTTANPTEPEQPVSGEPESEVRHSAFDLPIFEPDCVVTSAPDVSPPDSTTVAAVPDHVVVAEKPSDLRPREYPISFATPPFGGSALKKPYKFPKSFLKPFKSPNENEIPFTE